MNTALWFGLYVKILTGFYTGCTGRVVNEVIPQYLYLVHTECIVKNDVYTFFNTYEVGEFQVMNHYNGDARNE